MVYWCALLTAVENYNKSLEKLQDFFFKTQDQDQMFKTKTSLSKTKTFIFVLEVPRYQDPSLEDYNTAFNVILWTSADICIVRDNLGWKNRTTRYNCRVTGFTSDFLGRTTEQHIIIAGFGELAAVD